MEAERWRQVEQLYHSVLAVEESERTAFLEAPALVTKRCGAKCNLF